MTEIQVDCDPISDGWRCAFRVTEGSRTSTFAVTTRDPATLLPAGAATPRAGDVARLVRETFVFLLEREPVSSILPSFDLAVVARYFPAYPTEIRRRLTR